VTNRISSPTRQRDGVTVLDIAQYSPFLLTAVGSAWQRKTSALYRERFGFGIGEWRVLSMLNIEPKITANRICTVIRLDKAAVSRSLKLLHDRGLVAYEASASDPRKRRWWLTGAGQEIHTEVLAIALGCEAEMLAGVAPEDLEVFLRVMSHMLANFEE
jgi:DNA-binding MarR family transcriptional regulator